MRERQRDYELMLIISPLRSSEDEINATISRVQLSITSSGGEIASVDQSAPWGRRKLAYPIFKYAEGEPSRRPFNEGYYVLIRFQIGTEQINEFERQLKLTDAVIRYLITLIDHRGDDVPVVASSADASDADEGDEE